MNLIKIKKLPVFLLCLLLLAAVSCLEEDENPSEATATAVPHEPTSTPETEPTAVPATATPAIQTEGVLISELLPGVAGDNNKEFIELYNAGQTAVNLQGWTLSYLLAENQAEQEVYAWETAVDIPPQGHLLLVRLGSDFGITPDAFFGTPLFERKGGLLLRNADGEVVDRLGWGSDAPESATAGSPADPPPADQSIERLPGGDGGNAQQSDHNATDFIISEMPSPQNSGSPATPPVANGLHIALTAPELLPPGEQFTYDVAITNESDDATAVTVNIPIADHFTLLESPEGGVLEDGRLQWRIDEVGAGETAVSTILLESPFTYKDALVTSYYAEADGLLRAYGAPTLIVMGGGAVPIAIARDLTGSVVTVEGVATMYTGGFFGGSTSNKFYIEDASGGIQVFSPGGQGTVDIDIGDVVRVTGEIEIFRDSVEIIPLDNATDVEVLGTANPPSPTPISASDNENDDSLLGRLTALEGTALRVEEFNFSYEIDLLDDAGDTTLVLIEKDTGITAEGLTEGTRYQFTGITELASGRRQLKPRLQSDIREVFPPVLLIEQQGPITAAPGDVLSYTIRIFNHTPDPMTTIEVGTSLPMGELFVTHISDDGAIVGEAILWTIDELAGDGAMAELSYAIAVGEGATGTIRVGPAVAVSDQLSEPATTASFTTFVGDEGIPIWAIQGQGERSPYTQAMVTTGGVVTAVFPELGGFWIQEVESDDDPLTSAGLFIFTDQLVLPIVAGDGVEVSGVVRELSGQTAVAVDSLSDIVLVESEATLPEVIIYDPPPDMAEAQIYNESLEGMLVTIDNSAIVIAPTTRFGEYTAVYEKWAVDHVARTDEVGYLMFVDDGSTVAHVGRSSLPYAVKTGDRIAGVVGPLAYTFGNYKVASLTEPQIDPIPIVLPQLPLLEEDQFSIATFNVENLFDFLDPHPSSPDLPLPREYRAKIDRLARAIQLMGFPTVIGLQEVENVEVLEDLVSHELLLEFGYQPLLIEGFDSRGIDVGTLVRGDQATVELVSIEGAEETLFSRPPLLVQLTLLANGETLYVLNNHFLSLSAGEVATEPTRTAQAQWNADLVTRLRQDDPQAHFVVLGDLNSFYQTPPLDALTAVDLRHVYEFVEDDALPYTYIFEGRTQTLDHILVSEGLFEQLVSVTAVHINADFPIADPDTDALERTSDHDPLLAVFEFGE